MQKSRSIMQYYHDKEYIKKVIADGYEDLLIAAQLYWAHVLKGVEPKLNVLQKPKIQVPQQQRSYKPKGRKPKITKELKSKIMQMLFSELPTPSCRKIARKLYEQEGISVHYSTVYRIIQHKYKRKNDWP